MILGLDVGGTHTDAVLLDEKGIVSSYKTTTDHDNLINSVNKAIHEVTKDINKDAITTINLSTTLSTNAIVEKKIEDVGVIISSGPGIDPENFKIGENYYIIEGSIDHRGTIIKNLLDKQLDKSKLDLRKKNIHVFAAVTKFSTRNPDQENYIKKSFSEISDFITLGHQMSGQLSFPRRIVTAYYNSAVWRIYNKFADAVIKGIDGLGINAQINILKADGGTMPLAQSRDLPVNSILSGPAASIMGIISLCNITDDSIIFDIGGTTTDIAIFASGAPLIEKDGITLDSYPTLVRALKTESIGIGGDSEIKIINNSVVVGPERKGQPLSLGGMVPTLVDAFNYKDIIAYGNRENSIKGIKDLAERDGLLPDLLADSAIEYAVDKIKREVDYMLKEINDRPVYTIHEMFEGKKIVPKKIYVMGGPTKAFGDFLSTKFNIEVIIPEKYDVANAIGAALAKPTIDVELFADTGKGELLVPNLNIRKKISNDYSVEKAEQDAKMYLLKHLSDVGVETKGLEVEIIESSSFKMVQDFYSSGKDIRVKCQIKPGVIMNIHSKA